MHRYYNYEYNHNQHKHNNHDKLGLSLIIITSLLSSLLTCDSFSITQQQLVRQSYRCQHGYEYVHLKPTFRVNISTSTPTNTPAISTSISFSTNAVQKRSTRSRLYQETPPPTSEASSSSEASETNSASNLQNLSRRQLALLVPALVVGGTAYAKLASDVLRKILRGETYPPEHENRAKDTFEMTLITSASSLLQPTNDSNSDINSNINSDGRVYSRPLRILEVGIGSSCRTFLRGTYNDAIAKIIQMNRDQKKPMNIINGIEFTGVDIDIPKDEKIVQNARDFLNKSTSSSASSSTSNSDDSSFPITLNVQLGDITKGLPFPDGYFDAITSSLVLCSVEDQDQAITEIKRLVNPNGGTYGYIEHVAVNLENEAEKDLAFLNWQQEVFDPSQQLLAHNCHLHRNTDSVIKNIFIGADSNSSTQLVQSERFQVKDMWPVSCQSRGVIQLFNKQYAS